MWKDYRIRLSSLRTCVGKKKENEGNTSKGSEN